MSNVSWLLSPASRLITTDTGTITGCQRRTGVASRHITTAARYHMGQRGLRNHSRSGGTWSRSSRQWIISQEKTMYGTTIVVTSAHRCRLL